MRSQPECRPPSQPASQPVYSAALHECTARTSPACLTTAAVHNVYTYSAQQAIPFRPDHSSLSMFLCPLPTVLHVSMGLTVIRTTSMTTSLTVSPPKPLRLYTVPYRYNPPFYSATIGEWCIAISWSACVCLCVCVCLSVREHISGTAGPIFAKFYVQIPCDRGSVLL